MPIDTQQLYEETLVLRSQMGDELAFRELLTLYGPRLLLFARKMMHEFPDLAEDLTQEIWLAIFKGLPSLSDLSKFRAWAFRIARDRIYREFRRRKMVMQPLDECRPEELRDVADADPGFDLEELERGLQAVSPVHREVLVLCFLEEMSYAEIARITGTSLGTVRSRIHYAKRALRSALERKTL